MATDLVKALWVGGFRAELPDGTSLDHGVSEAQVPRGEAEQSANWQIVARKSTADTAQGGEE